MLNSWRSCPLCQFWNCRVHAHRRNPDQRRNHRSRQCWHYRHSEQRGASHHIHHGRGWLCYHQVRLRRRRRRLPIGCTMRRSNVILHHVQCLRCYVLFIPGFGFGTMAEEHATECRMTLSMQCGAEGSGHSHRIWRPSSHPFHRPRGFLSDNGRRALRSPCSNLTPPIMTNSPAGHWAVVGLYCARWICGCGEFALVSSMQTQQ
jgi:hypothetical protein